MPTNFLRLDFLQEWMQNDVSVCHVIEGNIIAPSLKIRCVDGMFVFLFTVKYRVVSRSFVTIFVWVSAFAMHTRCIASFFVGDEFIVFQLLLTFIIYLTADHILFHFASN